MLSGGAPKDPALFVKALSSLTSSAFYGSGGIDANLSCQVQRACSAEPFIAQTNMPTFSSLADTHGVRRLIVLLLLAFLAGFGPLCTDMYLPALPAIADDLGMSASLSQASIASCLLGLALGQIVIGPLSDGMGRKGILLASLLLFVLASIACAFSSHGGVFLIFRFLQGLGGSGGAVLCRAMSCDSFKGPRLTQFMALFMAITGIAPVLGPLVGGTVADTFGWQAIFLLLSAIGLLLLVGSLFFLPETLSPDLRVRGGMTASFINMLNISKEKAFLWYMGVQGCTAAGFFCYISASPFVFLNLYAFSVGQFTLFFGINALVLTLFSLLAGKLSIRFGDRLILTVGNAVRAVMCLSIFVVSLFQPESPVPLMAALIGMLASQGLTKPTSFTLAIMAQNVGAGAASGVLGVAFFVCGAMASPLAGIAGAESALPLGILSALSGLGALCCNLCGNHAFDLRTHRSACARSLLSR